MNRTLIVSYDLSDPGRNYERLVRLIKDFEGWARLGGSAYLISTERTPVQVRDTLRAALDANDKLFVGLAPPPAAWVGLGDEVSKWIHANQR